METKELSNNEIKNLKTNNKINTRLISLCSLLLIDYAIYSLTKLIKTNQKCLKINKCSLSFKSRKIKIIKNISFFTIWFLVINILIPFNKYMFKIPLLNSLYSLLIILIISIKLVLFNNIINILNRENCLKCIGLNKQNITSIIVKYLLKFNLTLKYKFLASIILIYYIILKYI